MVDVEIHKTVNPLGWNERLKASPQGNVFQTIEWAEYLRAQDEAEPLFLTAREDGEVVGLWMLTRGCRWQERMPSERRGVRQERHGVRSLLHAPLRSALARVAAEYRWKYGPVVLRAEAEEAILSALCRGLDELARSERISRVTGDLPPADSEVGRGVFASSDFSLQPRATFLLDTTADVDTLWKRLKPSARKAVRHCEEQDVRVERIEDEAPLEAYHAVLRETRARLGLDMPPYFPNAAMWKCLRPNGHLEVFLAWQGNRVLAGMGVLVFNGIVFEVGSATSDEAVAQRIYAGDLIKWNIIRWAHESGHRAYDLAGVALEPSTEKERQIYQFKAKWGGRLVRCDEFSMNYPTPWRRLWRAVRHLSTKSSC